MFLSFLSFARSCNLPRDHCIRKIVLCEVIVFLNLLLSACLLVNLGVLNRSSDGELEHYKEWNVVTSILAIYVIITAVLLLWSETLHIVKQGRIYFTVTHLSFYLSSSLVFCIILISDT